MMQNSHEIREFVWLHDRIDSWVEMSCVAINGALVGSGLWRPGIVNQRLGNQLTVTPAVQSTKDLW